MYADGGLKNTHSSINRANLCTNYQNCAYSTFNTHELDQTGLSYFNARYYDSDTGRFISPDPTIPNPTSTQHYNRYMFVTGNPISLMDASGYSGTTGGAQGTVDETTEERNDDAWRDEIAESEHQADREEYYQAYNDAVKEEVTDAYNDEGIPIDGFNYYPDRESAEMNGIYPHIGLERVLAGGHPYNPDADVNTRPESQRDNQFPVVNHTSSSANVPRFDSGTSFRKTYSSDTGRGGYGAFGTTGLAAYMFVESYQTARTIRIRGHNKFRGLSDDRHAWASEQLTIVYGPHLTRTYGVLNEIQGLVMHDLPDLRARLSGERPWAFQFSDLIANEVGIKRGEAVRDVLKNRGYFQ
jgi:RHS repeat-associated protein